MSTRARIGIVRPNGSVLSIYTHSDGYVSHHGPILLENYRTPQAVLALIKMGDASQLNETLDDCIFYRRDRGENGSGITPKNNKNQLLFYHSGRVCNAEWMYLYCPLINLWQVAEVRRSPDNPPIWQDLLRAVITERLTA